MLYSIRKVDKRRAATILSFILTLALMGCNLESKTTVNNEAEFAVEKVITVGSGAHNHFRTLTDALEYLDDRNITNDELYTIKLGGEIFESYKPILLNHPNGDNIKITGQNPTVPIKANISITGSQSEALITLDAPIPEGVTAGMVAWITRADPENPKNESLLGGYVIKSINPNSNKVTIEMSNNTFFVDPKKQYKDILNSTAKVIFLKTILKFIDCNGLELNQGNRLNEINNLAIVGNGANHSHGIIVNMSSSLNTSKSYKVAIMGFHVGLKVTDNSSMFANGFSVNDSKGGGVYASSVSTINAFGLIAGNNGSHGVLSDLQSFIYCDKSVIVNNQGAGILSTNGSSISASDSISKHSKYAGIASNNKSSVIANSTLVENSGDHGFFAWGGSNIYANSSISKYNVYNGYLSQFNSFVYGADSKAEKNGQDGYSSFQSSTILVPGASVIDNEGYGMHAGYNSYIRCDKVILKQKKGLESRPEIGKANAEGSLIEDLSNPPPKKKNSVQGEAQCLNSQ